MDRGAVPTKKELADELAEFLADGLGRALPGDKGVEDVQALDDLSRRLADDRSEDWPIRIARVVIEALDRIGSMPERLAIADMLGVDLEERTTEEAIEGIEFGEAIAALEMTGGRYERAGQRFRSPTLKDGYSERRVKEKLRRKWLERVAELLLVPVEEERPAEPPILLVGAVGAILVVIGVGWLVGVAAGAIG